jgi:HAD superfamily hydrolase (TIGR01490 family)
VADRKFAVFDIDGTVFRWQLYYEVVLRLAERGFFNDHEAALLKSQFDAWQSRTKTFHDFEVVAIDLLTSSLPLLPVADFKQVVAEVLNDSSHKVYSYTRGLAKELKKDGYFLLALSGSMQEIAEPFSKLYGFDDCIGWLYEQKGGRFTGKTIRKTVGNKAELLKQYVAEQQLSFKKSVGIGDSKGDIDMLEIVERPIAFNPSSELLDEARDKGWTVVIERKNLAYTLKRSDDGIFVLAEAVTV